MEEAAVLLGFYKETKENHEHLSQNTGTLCEESNLRPLKYDEFQSFNCSVQKYDLNPDDRIAGGTRNSSVQQGSEYFNRIKDSHEGWDML